MTQPKEKFYNITPLRRLPPTVSQFFTYKSDKEFNKGDLVLIEFRNRKQVGIILDCFKNQAEEKTYKIKNILSLVEKAYLNPWQIDFLKEAAAYYLAPFSFFLKAALPQKTVSRSQKIYAKPARKSFRISRDEITVAKELGKKLDKQKEILFIGKDRLAVYLYLISQTLNSGGQTLFLVPDIFLLRAYFEYFKQIFGSNRVGVLDKERAFGQYYDNWQDFKKGNKKILVGTRSAILASFNNLKLIIIDEAHDSSFKQWDQSPYYDARALARKLTKHLDTKLILGSNCPNINFFHKAKGKKKFFIKDKDFFLEKKPPQLGQEIYPQNYGGAHDDDGNANRDHIILTAIGHLTPSRIIDFSEKPNFNLSKIISDGLVEQIKSALDQKGTVFLGTSQKGITGCYFCGECGYIPQCSRCQRNFFLNNDNYFLCPVCGKREEPWLKCPKCENKIIKLLGVGTGRLNQEMRRLFPGKQVVFLNESDRPVLKENKIKLALTLDSAIVIGNVNNLRLAKLNAHSRLVISLNADKSFFLPDYIVFEKKYQEIGQLLSDKFKVFVQTKYPQNKLIQNALKNNYGYIYRKEIKLRKKEKLPPFSRLIKFTAREKEEGRAQDKLTLLKKEIDKEINSVISTVAAEVKSTGSTSDYFFLFEKPYPGYPEKVRGNYIFHLTLGSFKNFKLGSREFIDLAKYCYQNKIKIDVNPVSLI